MPADVVGTEIFDQRTATFSVKRGPIFANIVLADEINRGPAKVQAALLEAMEEKQVTIGGTSFRLDEPFLVLATQNRIEQEGRYPLPEAQVDGFMLKPTPVRTCPPPQDRGAANVWQFPPLPLAAITLALWFAAGMVLALAGRQGPVGGRWLLLAPSVLLLAVAAYAEARLRADDLLVIASAARLRTLPALGAESGSVPLVGEVVTILERRGVWVFIALDAGREGWYPTERTYPRARLTCSTRSQRLWR